MTLHAAARMVLGAATLLAAIANAQHLPLALTSASLSGTNGDSAFPRAHVGETVEVQVGIWSFCDFDFVTVHSVSLLIHHGSGDVTIPNLLAAPTVLAHWGDFMVVTTNFIVQPDDSDILLVDYAVAGSFNSDGSGISGGIPRSFLVEFGCHIVILRSGPPILQITRAGPAGVRVSWSIASEGFQLESTDDLGGTWTAVAGVPAVKNGEFTVTLGTSDGRHQFYRLAKP